MPKCENFTQKPKWLSMSIFESISISNTNFIYLRGNVSATTKCLCDDYTSRALAPWRREIHLRMSNIYTAVGNFKWLSVSQLFCMIIILRCIHSYKYLMMCHSAVIAHTIECLSFYPGLIALEIYKYYQIFQINTNLFTYLHCFLLFAFESNRRGCLFHL